MPSFTPIRDAANKIVDLSPRDQHQPTGFAALLAETMEATGAAPAPAPAAPAEEPRAPRSFGRIELAGVVIGLVIALALFAVFNWLVPAQEAPRAPVRPTVATTAAPTAAAPAAVATTAPTATPEPATDTPEPPTQTAVVVYIEKPCDPNVNPAFVARLDVYAGSVPLGFVSVPSCESMEAAQADAEQLAAEMRTRYQAAIAPPPTATTVAPYQVR